MQIRKTYREVSPELLYAEIKDFTLKRGAILKEDKMETYTLPDQSATFVSRGTLIFSSGKETGKECIRVNIVGSAREETKLMLDIDEELFPQDKVSALMDDLDFIFGTREEEE